MNVTHYGLPVIERDGSEFAFAKDDAAADAAAREYIIDSLWAFRSEFLRDYIPSLQNEAARKEFDKMRESVCEDANELVRAMLGDRLDELVDGRNRRRKPRRTGARD